MWLNKKKMKISDVLGFPFGPLNKIQKDGNLGKFSFALNFDCFNCIKRRKAEYFH